MITFSGKPICFDHMLAAALGHPTHQLRVLCGDIGGSFGEKSGLAREEVAIAAAAKLLGRPVKWTEDRTENLTVAGQAREERMDVEAAVAEIEAEIRARNLPFTVETVFLNSNRVGLLRRRSCCRRQ